MECGSDSLCVGIIHSVMDLLGVICKTMFMVCHSDAGCGDGFMVNTVALCLRLCNVFVNDRLAQHNRDNTTPPKIKDLLEKLNPSFYLSNPHRLGNMEAVATLAGECTLVNYQS